MLPMDPWVLPVLLGVSATGWSTIVAVYPDRDFSPSESWLAAFVGFGRLGQYRGVVRIQTDPIGVRFSVLWLFEAGHRPFVVPWSEVSVDSTTGFLQRVTFAQVPGKVLRINSGSVERMEAASGRSLRR